MASKLRSLRRNIAKLEKMGFILPSYMYSITKESTARKYNQKKMMEVAKFQKADGKIVSGKKGREIILEQRAQKAVQTRAINKKKKEQEEKWSREEQAKSLDIRIMQYFDQFINRELSKKFTEIYKAAKYSAPSELQFLLGLLDIEKKVIETLQEAILITGSDQEKMQSSANGWLEVLTGNSPTMEQRKEVGDAGDSGESADWVETDEESPWG